MDKYFVKPQIYMGADHLPEVLKEIACVLVVNDRFMCESGKVRYLTEPMEQMGISYQIFSDVKPDPDIATVSKGIALLKELRPQMILAFGGGSAIDAAKAIGHLSYQQGYPKKCRLVAVPTTSGTGTEVSRFSVISDPERSKKYPLIAEGLLPDVVILDPETTRSVPPRTTADTGMDVLTHAYEAYVSVDSNDLTDAAAEKAIRLVRDYLLPVYRDPDDLGARQKMQHASCLAGMAFSNAGLGLNHGMAHTLGGHFHIPHGRANAVLLPYVICFNSGYGEELTDAAVRYAQIAGSLRVDVSDIRRNVFQVLRFTRQLIRDLGIPASIAGLGVSREGFMDVLEEMVEDALCDSCTATDPRKCTAEEVRELFLKAYDGKYL